MNKYENKLMKYILNEKYLGENDDAKMPKGDRDAFLEAVGNFHKLGEMVYANGRLQEVTKTLQSVVEQAEKVTISESEHWFDNVTVSRHMKQMNEAYKVFEKTSTEMNSMQQRLESAYEDMGSVLNRYYKIGEALREDNLEITEAIAVVDGSDRKSKILKALLKQHRVTMKVINQAGSGGKNLKVKLTGSRKDLKAVLQSEEGWGINDVQNYIK